MIFKTNVSGGGSSGGGLPFEEVSSFALLYDFILQDNNNSGFVLIENSEALMIPIAIQFSRLVNAEVNYDAFTAKSESDTVIVFNYLTGSQVVFLEPAQQVFENGYSARYFIYTG